MPKMKTETEGPPCSQMKSKLLGVIVVARNGDRQEFYQDPQTFRASPTEPTALGEVESHHLGCLLRETYLDSDSPSYISGMVTDVVDNDKVKVKVKAGVEGIAVFDSAMALLQGLYPPTPKNKITLANSAVVTAPLGGYQYVPVETIEPSNDRSLESWTDCPNFQKHIRNFYDSEEFKEKAQDANHFFDAVRDFVFGRTTSLENIWNIYDFMNSQYTHNQTFAYRLPPTLIDQARALADFHANGAFSDKQLAGPGNIAGRSILHTILHSLERVAFNHDPLRFLLIETTYQPFISIFHMTGLAETHPHLRGIPDFASALVFELRRGPAPENRDFLRVKFRNGTASSFETLPLFEHHGDTPVTEFIYRIRGSTIRNDVEWSQACGTANDHLGLTRGEHNPSTETFILFAVVALGVVLKLMRLFWRSWAQKNARPLGEPAFPNQEKMRYFE